MKFVKKNNIWYKHNNNSDKLYNFFHGWTNYDSINDIEEEFDNWHDLYEKTGWHPFIGDEKAYNVWISPNGEYFACSSHFVGAKQILEVIYNSKDNDFPDDFLVSHGWVKATTSLMWNMFYYKENYTISNKTKDALERYCEIHNLRKPENIIVV